MGMLGITDKHNGGSFLKYQYIYLNLCDLDNEHDADHKHDVDRVHDVDHDTDKHDGGKPTAGMFINYNVLSSSILTFFNC